MFLTKQRTYSFIFLSSLFALSSACGMEDNDPKLVKGAARHYSTGAEKPVLQIIDNDGKPLHDPKLFFDIDLLRETLKLAEEECSYKIKELLENAYTSLKQELGSEYGVDKIAIRNLLLNYLEESNEEEIINNVTGVSLSPDERSYFKTFITLCGAVYTDGSTRDFLEKQNLESSKKKLNDIIDKKNEIIRLHDLIVQRRDKMYEAKDLPPVIILDGGKSPSTQAENLMGPMTISQSKRNYKDEIVEINKYLIKINKDIIVGEEIEDITAVIRKLENIHQEIGNEFSWHFEENPEKIESLIYEDTALPLPKFQAFEKGLPKEYQLTAKAVIASSFLMKAGFLDKENITILDVGFRNKETFGSLLNKITTSLATIKYNPKAWFKDYGEVDYVAYIEKDPNQIKDKLVITYSGSNGQKDWGINFTTGHRAFYGLSVHEGISWLFNQSINTSHPILMSRIKKYYDNTLKPRGLDIVIMGHSLGGSLAELAAYHYQVSYLEEFKNILRHDGIDHDEPEISVKTFTFGAPAIVDKNSKEVIEMALGKNNIYRVWAVHDLVAEYTDGDQSTIGKLTQNAVHIGKSIPLYNVQNLSTSFLDWWGPHGVHTYKGYLHALGQENYSSKYKKFIDILNGYIQKEGLNTYKMGLKKLHLIRDDLEKSNLSHQYKLSRNLAQDIMKYYPAPFNVKPDFLPQANQDIQPLGKGILRYLINYPQHHGAVDLKYGADVEGNFNTYHKITEIINFEKTHLLNDLINISCLKDLFIDVEDKEVKFKKFRENFNETLVLFDRRNTAPDKEKFKIYEYRKNEKLHAFHNYMDNLKQFILNLEWEIITPTKKEP